MAKRSVETVARRGGAVLLLLLPAVFFASILCLAVAGKGMLDHTIEHSRQIEAGFLEAARLVDAFRAERGRLPSRDETEQRLSFGGPFIVEAREGFFQEAVAALGQPPEGGYVLGLWRGEWMEYYASWSGATTMPFEESAYYETGSRAGDCLAGVLGLLICLAGSVRLGRGSRRG